MSTQLYLLNSILEEYKIDGSFSDIDKAFEFFASEQILKNKEIGTDEIESGHIGASRDGGVDGFYLFVNDEYVYDSSDVKVQNSTTIEIHLMQFKNTTKVEEGVLDRFNSSADHLFLLGVDIDSLVDLYNPKFIDKIRLFHDVWRKVATKHPKIKVFYYHACKGEKNKTLGSESTNEVYLRKMNLLRQKVIDTCGGTPEFVYQIVDTDTLMELSRKKPTYSLSLKLNETPITIDYNQSQGGYIASTTLYEYYKFLSDTDGSLRKYLFESNIRDYQNKTDVNSDIYLSVTEKEEFDFWWLNNGVTIIAEKSTLSGKILNLDNIQIVNGLQTSYTIFNAISKGNYEDDDRSILLKIVITGAKETTDAIIKSTNSQNYVPPSTLRATDKVQREIEEYLLLEGYYYDRRKNFYRNQGKPRNKIISIKYLSQCLTAVVQKNPSKARSNPTTLTKNEKDYQRLFPRKRQPIIYLKSIEVNKRIERYLRGLDNEDMYIEAIISNYPFHVARIAVSLALGVPDYNDSQFATMDLTTISDEVIANCVTHLTSIIKRFQETNSQKELINIAKNISFSEYITEWLLEEMKVRDTKIV